MADPIAAAGLIAKPEAVQLVSPGGLEAAGGAEGVESGGFADLLRDKLGSVIALQGQAESAAEAVATGRSDDLSGATIAVEKASIAIELVSAIRNKAIEAYQDVMRTQI
jgi:flagellar hook-basal body complex protein FliE